MRGEPNSIVCQLAWKPSAEMVELIGSVLPLKLGLGHGERTVAASSLPANCTANEAVPRRLTVDLNGTRTLPTSGGASGALAITSAAPRQACSCAQRFEARHPLPLGAGDRDAVGRAQPGEVRRRAERDRCLAPQETRRPCR